MRSDDVPSRVRQVRKKTGRYNSMEKLNANGDFWAWVDIDGKLYCPDCYEYDKETDEYKPKVKVD